MNAAPAQIAASDAPNGKGGVTEVNTAPIQDYAMLKVAERPTEGKAKQEVLDFLYEGFVKLTAVEMNRILQACQYEHQRPISEQHMLVLSDLMRRGQWLPKSQIDFAVLDGQYILINGYHRAYAQVRSGKTIEWSVVFHKVRAETDLRSLYFGFDTNIRVRGNRELLRASEFGDINGVPAEMADALYRAVPFIASNFATNPKDRNFLVEKQVDRRLEVAGEYAKAASRYGACLDGLNSHRKSRFRSAGVTAVAVITLRYQSAKAWEFWAGVAGNDGLKRGDPRLALFNDMLSRKATSRVEAFAPAMIAWNAFFNDRELRIIKVTEHFHPAIDGTPFSGRKA
jgi:hypothetical protein